MPERCGTRRWRQLCRGGTHLYVVRLVPQPGRLHELKAGALARGEAGGAVVVYEVAGHQEVGCREASGRWGLE
jgi:hypothetical protein